jgi:hypothetical protein
MFSASGDRTLDSQPFLHNGSLRFYLMLVILIITWAITYYFGADPDVFRIPQSIDSPPVHDVFSK